MTCKPSTPTAQTPYPGTRCPRLSDDLEPVVRPKIVEAAGFLITVARRKQPQVTRTRHGTRSPVRSATPGRHSTSSHNNDVPVNFEGPRFCARLLKPNWNRL